MKKKILLFFSPFFPALSYLVALWSFFLVVVGSLKVKEGFRKHHLVSGTIHYDRFLAGRGVLGSLGLGGWRSPRRWMYFLLAIFCLGVSEASLLDSVPLVRGGEYLAGILYTLLVMVKTGLLPYTQSLIW